MNKKINIILITLVILIPTVFIPITTNADMGPKPSVHFEIEGIQETCYMTLLSKTDAFGPYGIYKGTSESKKYYEEPFPDEIWQAFVDYQDSDHFYFLQYFKDISTGIFSWIYYPPETFKILLYFPESHTFITDNQIIEQYAFETHYKIIVSNQGAMDVSKTKVIEHFQEEELKWINSSLGYRMIITIIIELILAFLFKIKSFKYIGIIVTTNIITQFLLNYFIVTMQIKQASPYLVAYYLALEILVVGIECFIYLYNFKDTKPKKIILYTMIANLASFGIGLLVYI